MNNLKKKILESGKSIQLYVNWVAKTFKKRFFKNFLIEGFSDGGLQISVIKIMLEKMIGF